MFTIEQLIEHIKKGKPKAAASLAAAAALQLSIDRHITGTKFHESLVRIEGLENTAHFDILKKIAAPQTPPLFQKFRNQFSKIFRADGFNFRYIFDQDNENLRSQAADYLEKIWHGKSLFSFMKSEWERLNDEAPNDIIIVELPVTVTTEPEPYLRVIPLSSVFDIGMTAGTIDWLIERTDFKRVNGAKYSHFRYIDKSVDLIILKEGETVYLNKREDGSDDVNQNRLGYVPAIKAGQIQASFRDQTCMVNQYFFGLLMADKYQSRCNDYDLSVKVHAWPLFYSYPIVCGSCNGSGQIFKEDDNDGEGAYHKCKTCKGKKVVKFSLKNAADGITVPMPMDAGLDQDVKSIATPAGYVNRDVEVIKLQGEVKQEAKLEIEESVMGVAGLIERGASNTATEELINYQPILDRMHGHSDRGEGVHRFLANTSLDFRYNTTKVLTKPTGEKSMVKRFIESVINYGKTYVLRSETEYDSEYKQAKEAGMPDTYLLTILKEKISAKWQNNTPEKMRNIFLLEVMPFPTYTVKELSELQIGTAEDKGVKAAFNDIVEIFEEDNGDVLKFIGERAKVKEMFFEIYADMIAVPGAVGGGAITDADGNLVGAGAVDLEAEAKAKLRGTVGGITGIIAINQAVSAGEMTEAAAEVIITEVYGYSPEVANRMIDNPEKVLTINTNKDETF